MYGTCKIMKKHYCWKSVFLFKIRIIYLLRLWYKGIYFLIFRQVYRVKRLLGNIHIIHFPEVIFSKTTYPKKWIFIKGRWNRVIRNPRHLIKVKLKCKIIWKSQEIWQTVRTMLLILIVTKVSIVDNGGYQRRLCHSKS